MSIRPPKWNLEDVDGGYVVCRHQFRADEYVGRDGYWCRDKNNALPFKTRDEARRKLNELVDAEERR